MHRSATSTTSPATPRRRTHHLQEWPRRCARGNLIREMPGWNVKLIDCGFHTRTAQDHHQHTHRPPLPQPRTRPTMRTETSEELDRIENVGQDQHNTRDQDDSADDVRDGQQPRRVDRTRIGSAAKASESPSHRLVERGRDVPAVQWQQRHEIEERHEQVDRAEHGEQTCDLCCCTDLVRRSDLPAARLAPTIDIGP